jgi:hypothetical protein
VSQTSERLGPDAVDAELQRVLPIFNSSPGLGAAPRSIDEVAAAFERRFPDAGGYRETPAKWYDPARSDTWINRMARQGSDYRDRAIVQTLAASTRDHQRVLAVVGGTHVVMQEAALEALLGTRARRLDHGCE